MDDFDAAPTLAEVIRRLDGIDKRLSRVLDDHEIRLRSVERWVYAIPPTLVIAVAAVVAAVIEGGSQ